MAHWLSIGGTLPIAYCLLVVHSPARPRSFLHRPTARRTSHCIPKQRGGRRIHATCKLHSLRLLQSSVVGRGSAGELHKPPPQARLPRNASLWTTLPCAVAGRWGRGRSHQCKAGLGGQKLPDAATTQRRRPIKAVGPSIQAQEEVRAKTAQPSLRR